MNFNSGIGKALILASVLFIVGAAIGTTELSDGISTISFLNTTKLNVSSLLHVQGTWISTGGGYMKDMTCVSNCTGYTATSTSTETNASNLTTGTIPNGRYGAGIVVANVSDFSTKLGNSSYNYIISGGTNYHVWNGTNNSYDGSGLAVLNASFAKIMNGGSIKFNGFGFGNITLIDGYNITRGVTITGDAWGQGGAANELTFDELSITGPDPSGITIEKVRANKINLTGMHLGVIRDITTKQLILNDTVVFVQEGILEVTPAANTVGVHIAGVSEPVNFVTLKNVNVEPASGAIGVAINGLAGGTLVDVVNIDQIWCEGILYCVTIDGFAYKTSIQTRVGSMEGSAIRSRGNNVQQARIHDSKIAGIPDPYPAIDMNGTIDSVFERNNIQDGYHGISATAGQRNLFYKNMVEGTTTKSFVYDSSSNVWGQFNYCEDTVSNVSVSGQQIFWANQGNCNT